MKPTSRQHDTTNVGKCQMLARVSVPVVDTDGRHHDGPTRWHVDRQCWFQGHTGQHWRPTFVGGVMCRFVSANTSPEIVGRQWRLVCRDVAGILKRGSPLLGLLYLYPVVFSTQYAPTTTNFPGDHSTTNGRERYTWCIGQPWALAAPSYRMKCL